MLHEGSAEVPCRRMHRACSWRGGAKVQGLGFRFWALIQVGVFISIRDFRDTPLHSVEVIVMLGLHIILSNYRKLRAEYMLEGVGQSGFLPFIGFMGFRFTDWIVRDCTWTLFHRAASGVF